MAGVVVSPAAGDPKEVPEISLSDYMFNKLNQDHLPKLSSKPWVVDVLTGTSVKFDEVEDLSKCVASALVRLGFKKGDVLYYVTFESAHLLIFQLAVWRLGGAVRGCYQAEEPSEYCRQLGETRSKFVLVDSETAPVLLGVVSSLEWPVTLLSVGIDLVPQTIHYSSLIQDDGTAFPETVAINPREDAVFIANTSGSTGLPKGVVLTNYAAVALIHGLRTRFLPISQMSLAGTFAISHFYCSLSSFYSGATIHFMPKFQRQNFLNKLVQYKPMQFTMYPYVASWFARAPELSHYDLTFLKVIVIGGSVLDSATAKLLNEQLPGAMLTQIYASSECPGIAYSAMAVQDLRNKTLKVIEHEGEMCVSSGPVLPYVQLKVVDPDSGSILNSRECGEILVKAPYLMKGYITNNKQEDRSDIDSEGWLHTGDLGFVDEDSCVYVKERKSYIFKYFMHFVMPSEIEAVLQEHEAVLSAGVVGMPNPETTSLARALVVLRPGLQVSAPELIEFVASRLPSHKHLHGGVTFIDNLPVNRGGKLDRQELLKIALNNN